MCEDSDRMINPEFIALAAKKLCKLRGIEPGAAWTNENGRIVACSVERVLQEEIRRTLECVCAIEEATQEALRS